MRSGFDRGWVQSVSTSLMHGNGVRGSGNDRLGYYFPRKNEKMFSMGVMDQKDIL